MDIPPARIRDGKSGTAGDGDLHLPSPEHGHTVHYNQGHYGPVSGGETETRAKDIQAIVGSV